MSFWWCINLSCYIPEKVAHNFSFSLSSQHYGLSWIILDCCLIGHCVPVWMGDTALHCEVGSCPSCHWRTNNYTPRERKQGKTTMRKTNISHSHLTSILAPKSRRTSTMPVNWAVLVTASFNTVVPGRKSCEEECYCGQGALIYHLDIWHPGLCRHDPPKTPSAYSGRRGGTPGK